MTSLQQEYNLIKEGKGNKAHFLKLARLTFPEQVGVHNTYEQAVSILRNKSLLSEGVGGVVSITNETPNWFKIFEAEVKADLKATDKEVVDMETKGFDYKDKKNIDNVYGQAFLVGYYVEMEDPKNAKKTVEELKGIVAKNLAKDMNFYVKDGQFGIKGIGYTPSPETKEVKGKYTSSGMEPIKLKESKYSLLEMMEEDMVDEGAMDDQIAAAEKEVAQKKKEAADAEKKAADIKAAEAAAEANA